MDNIFIRNIFHNLMYKNSVSKVKKKNISTKKLILLTKRQTKKRMTNVRYLTASGDGEHHIPAIRMAGYQYQMPLASRCGNITYQP